MKLLALEFSTSRRSLALIERTADGGAFRSRAEVESDGGRSAPVFALIDGLLEQAGWQRREVEGLIVGLGPGSHAGIRSALAVAQGWQVARSIRVAGVRSVDALAVAAAEHVSAGSPFGVVVDAQRGEFYFAEYRSGVVPIEPADLRIVGRDHLGEAVQRGLTLFGPDVEMADVPVTACHPRAVDLARCPRAEEWCEANALNPVHLRRVEFVKAPPARTDL